MAVHAHLKWTETAFYKEALNDGVGGETGDAPDCESG